ncbi:hypothetical protein I3760_16G065200 [Carya illinoinensis]|uniref:VQ domain-containing protein n=1 Tax=Carya illinoinensis TaxID=32201 RepID=A0A8T1N6B5_CARIL|nr:VQ motif-containing protein 8, chloroplastic-like [Carya illinoinensis]KAG2664130.1 hypothetical protein I3760_16G065200 [Carya illinoinensis]KAG6624998.1 hypothetical protein CIPAW_16G065400 [Carya illinoinensis]KAG6672520.1 hypothetical protein I3842_16G061800 [Carya illinoinensis]
MSPAKFNGDDDLHENSRREINGVRPSPLKIRKGSRFIHKPSSSTSNSSVPCVNVPARQQKQPRPPVIIYTQSPKIIHTHAKDFRALVQKLTGMSSPSSSNNNHETDTAQVPPDPDQPHESRGESAFFVEGNHNHNIKTLSNDDNDSSSVLTDENSSGGCGVDFKASSFSISSANESQSHPHFADIPSFTPNDHTNFYGWTRPVYQYPDSANISPAVFKFM